MFVGSPLPVREPPVSKEEPRSPPTNSLRTRSGAATSKPRSGSMAVRRVRSFRRPSPARSRISPAHGAMGPRSVSMTLRPVSPSCVRRRTGLPLMPWSA